MHGEIERGSLQRVQHREQVQRLLALAEHLDPADRLLVEHVYQHGRPISDLARITRTAPRRLQVRLSNLLRRMSTTEYRFLVTASHTLPPATRPIARRVVCRGLSYRQAAGELRLSLHRVRREMGRFRRCLHASLLAQRRTQSGTAS